MINHGITVRAPCDLEQIFDRAEEILIEARTEQETYGDIALACVYLELTNMLARAGIGVKKRVKIARLGADHKYERAVALFELFKLNAERPRDD